MLENIIEEEYVKSKGYSYFNPLQKTEYSEWLEIKLNESRTEVNKLNLDDVMVLFKPHELWRMAQKYNCDDFTKMIGQSKSLNKL